MKVITIKQPWASLIINGYKKYEFRSWKTKYRGEILIHAGKSIETKYLPKFEKLNIDYPTGYIIGKVTIEDCIELTEEKEKEIIKEDPLVYGHTTKRGGYAWKISNPKKIEPIKTNGKLGLWDYEKK